MTDGDGNLLDRCEARVERYKKKEKSLRRKLQLYEQKWVQQENDQLAIIADNERLQREIIKHREFQARLENILENREDLITDEVLSQISTEVWKKREGYDSR